MGRVAKKAPETPKPVEEIPTITQTRAKRTPKPNPRYANETLVATPKIPDSESNGSTDIEEKLPETKIVKSTAKASAAKQSAAKTAAAKAKAGAIKKQKIEFDDDEKTKDADEIPLPSPTPPPRTTRSGKGNEKDSEIKVGEESVSIIDVASIITSPEKREESPKVTRGSAGRKRQAEPTTPVVEIKEDSPKKKKEEEKTSLITARKSYMPATPANKAKQPIVEIKAEPKIQPEAKKEPVTENKKEEAAKNLANAIKTRRSILPQQGSPEVVDKKPKIEVKTSPVVAKAVEPKKLPVITRKEPMMKVITPNTAQKIITTSSEQAAKPAPRILNTMVTPKGAKESPIVKLAGDGMDRKVFSIEMSDGSVVEKRQTIVKSSPIKPSPIAVKENIAINKPQPSALLKNTLESELNRMKASANFVKRQSIPHVRSPAVRSPQGIASHATSPSVQASPAARRITKFESWYVIDVKDNEVQTPLKHTHTFSLIDMGNHIQEIELPSANWEYKITVQKRVRKASNDDEVYYGEITEGKIPESEKHNYQPNCILFKRVHKDNNPRVIIDRSIMFKTESYAITMNGKQCHLLGAPSDISSLEDIEILLKIIDSSSLSHSCVETNC